jgi:triacylglycerol lipase
VENPASENPLEKNERSCRKFARVRRRAFSTHDDFKGAVDMKRRSTGLVLAAVLACAGAVAPAARAADTYTQTRYPVVLVHGLFGFSSLAGVEYFYGIPSALRAGGANVIVVQVSAANSTEVRGEQLLKTLQQLRATYGYQKFNLIGHSHGGPTTRYVAGVAPQWVASVTTIGGPHAGSATADALFQVAGATGTTPIVGGLLTAFAQTIGLLSNDGGLPQDSLAGGRSQTTAYAAAFSARFPQGKPTSACGVGPESVNGVRYYSYGGAQVLTNPFDVTDAALAVSAVPLGFTPNDGLVSSCSSRWGNVIRADMPWNHLDEVNQAFGLRSVFAPDPPTVYRTHVNRLKSAGL